MEDALDSSRRWNCPRVGGSGKREGLDAEHLKALDRIERLTGHKFKTCPRAGLWERWVHDVVDAEQSGLADVRAVWGRVPNPLVEATRIVRQSRRAREAEEARVREQKRTKKTEAR